MNTVYIFAVLMSLHLYCWGEVGGWVALVGTCVLRLMLGNDLVLDKSIEVF